MQWVLVMWAVHCPVLGLIAFLRCWQVDVKKATPKEKMAAAANRGRGATNAAPAAGRGRGRGWYVLFIRLISVRTANYSQSELEAGYSRRPLDRLVALFDHVTLNVSEKYYVRQYDWSSMLWLFTSSHLSVAPQRHKMAYYVLMCH